jgi:hypothetical protein
MPAPLPSPRFTRPAPISAVDQARNLAILGLSFLFLPAILLGASHGDQTIVGLERWTARDSPHLVDGVITVEKSGTLIIDPGASVYFKPDYRSGIVVRGSLTAIGGSGDARIFLGTEAAHRLLGSTGAPEPPSWPPPYWRGIEFQDAAGPSLLDQVVISSALVGARVSDSIVDVTNSEFRDCGRGGEVEGSHAIARIRDSYFIRNTFGLDLLGNATSALSLQASENRFEENGIAINIPFRSFADVIAVANSYKNNLTDVVRQTSDSLASFNAVRPLA